jgi:simple sugar transport system substrate-binding protein
MEQTIKVAANFPDVKFEHATGYQRPTDNISTYSARFYEGRHVIGKIAGRMTQTNVIGYIASFPIPEVIRGINAAFLAAKSVNPDIQIKIVWVYTWFDPGKEADAANALIAQGADIIMQHTDSTAAMTVAEENEGVYAFGQASDMSAWGPTSHLTSIIDYWGPYYAARIRAVKDGTWTETDTFDGVPEGMVAFAALENMPDDVRKEAETTIVDLENSDVHPFTGPINKQDGSPWLADGETPPMFPDLLTMDFYVEGIDSKYPD